MDELNQSRVPRKARAILNRLLQSRQITEDGLRWLIQMTDPFHDTQLTLAGHPGGATKGSLVRSYITTTTIKRPEAYADEPWSLYMAFTPNLGGPTQAVITLGDGYLPSLGATFATLQSGLSVVCLPKANSTLEHAAAVPVDDLALPSDRLKYPCRIVGMAVEVANVTPEVYKSGSVTVSRQEACIELVRMNTTSNLPVTATWISGLPLGLNDIAIVPNSRTWEAKEGLYMIACLSDVENPVRAATFMPNYIGAFPVNMPQKCAMATGGPARTAPYDFSAAFFSGLSPQTVLQATVRYFVEEFPFPNSPDISVTRPACPYDPVALEIYQRTMQELPVACTIKENPLGEWFADILSIVERIAPALTGVPVLGRAASIVGPVAGAIARTIKPPGPVTPPKPVAPPAAAPKKAAKQRRRKAGK